MPSTVIRHITYDQATGTLRITFISGMVYDYLQVPEAVYANMKTAFSKGIFFNQHIKDRYAFRKVTAL